MVYLSKIPQDLFITDRQTYSLAMNKFNQRLEGMGAIIGFDGVGFRVWAPSAEKVGVVGDFQEWDDEKPLALEPEGEGYWYGFSGEAKAGQEYKILIENKGNRLFRLDPYARKITHSDGNAVIYDPSSFDWSDDSYELPPLTSLVIYECHLGTFAGNFEQAASKLRYLNALGVNAIELMPVTDFPGDRSWGYNPAHIFSVETNYGGVEGLKNFIKKAHSLGIGVILDLVYNHLGPDDLDLWDFEGEGGPGPYFYNDERAKTPWGDTRPNYSSGPVRQFLRDNLMMWLTEYNVDGVRTDGTVYVRRQEGPEGGDLADGWSLLQWFNEEVSSLPRWRVTIAEDLQNDEWLTRPVQDGGAGFNCQWDAGFCHPLREMLKSTEDADRSVGQLTEILQSCYNGDPFQSVIYTESHDEVANGSARMVTEIDAENPDSDHATARALLGIGLVLTAPGVPMLFQGQVRMEDGWFEDDQPIDWSGEGRDRKALRICQRLISLRSGVDQAAPELQTREIEVVRADEENGLLVVRRGDSDLLVFYNLHNRSPEIPLHEGFEVLARTGDGQADSGLLQISPYEVVVVRGQVGEQE